MLQKIKIKFKTTIEKLKKGGSSLIYFLKTRQLSEVLALVSVITGGFLLLAFIVFLINFISPRTKVEIEISGPKEAKAGELITYTVICKNVGNVILESPELIFNHSPYSLPGNIKNALVEVRGPEDFQGALYPNQTITFEFKTQLFGQEKEKREVKVWLNYKVRRGTISQTSDVVTFSSQISEVPLDLELSLPPKIPISPKIQNEFKFKIQYFSFAETTTPNLKIRVEYSPDFSFRFSQPQGITPKEWQASGLEKGDSGEVEINGVFPPEQKIGQKLNFEAQLFVMLPHGEVLLRKTAETSLTSERIILITQEINGRSEYSARAGERLHYRIYFKNLTDNPLRNLTLISLLEGNLYNLLTVKAPRGSFKPGDNSITWTKEQILELGYLRPAEKGSVDFWVDLKEDYVPKDKLDINTVVKNRVFLGGFEEIFENKVTSKVELVQEGFFRDEYGYFENSGRHPPSVNQTTTYTIIWRIKNYYNLLEEVEVKAKLPPRAEVKSIKEVGQGKISVSKKDLPIAYSGIPADFRFARNLIFGARAEEVHFLQIILQEEVPYIYTAATPISGYFGNITLRALTALQEKLGLRTTGNVDGPTRLELNKLLERGGAARTSEIVWELEKIEPGTGIFYQPLIAVFQVALTPSMAQKGRVAQIIDEVIFSGKDKWTGELVSIKDKTVDTTLPDDGIFRGEGRVR